MPTPMLQSHVNPDPAEVLERMSEIEHLIWTLEAEYKMLADCLR